MEVGDKIKKYRELQNYTQSYMSNQLDISQNTYSKIENGQIKLTVERLQRIAEVLNIPMEEFLKNERQSITFNNSSVDKFNGYIETIQEGNKKLMQSTINSLKDEIVHLRKENSQLIEALAKRKD